MYLSFLIFLVSHKKQQQHRFEQSYSAINKTGFDQAVEELEKLGPTSYIIDDLRNNYGGIVQSAMSLAASLLAIYIKFSVTQ